MDLKKAAIMAAWLINVSGSFLVASSSLLPFLVWSGEVLRFDIWLRSCHRLQLLLKV